MNHHARYPRRTMFWRAFVAAQLASICLILPACRIPCLRSADPAPSLPVSFLGDTSEENSSQIRVEEFFNDPLLTSLIYQSLSDNLELKILAEDIQIANNEILARKGAYFPFVNIGAGARVNKYSRYTLHGADNADNTIPGGGNFPIPLPNFLVAADVTWQIDIWRKLRNSRDSATLHYLGTNEGRNYVVTRLVAEVAENYYRLMSLDKQLETLDKTIQLQEQSLDIAKARKAAARGTELPVQRFQAEVLSNQSQKLIIKQDIVEAENRINFLLGRYPQFVERMSGEFIDLNLPVISTGIPAQLLANRPDIRQAERELAAAGLDVKVARARFYPSLTLGTGVGWEAFNTQYLFLTPQSLIYNAAGELIAPVINRAAIKADYMTANAKQLQALYNYQRTVLNAYTEVVNRMSKVQNYSQSIAIKKQQLESLETAVSVAGNLFQNARVEYVDVLFAQRDRNEAKMILIETKREQLSAIVNTYQALGGGLSAAESSEQAAITVVEESAPAK